MPGGAQHEALPGGRGSLLDGRLRVNAAVDLLLILLILLLMLLVLRNSSKGL